MHASPHSLLKGNAAWRALSDDEPGGGTDTGGCSRLLERVGFYSPERATKAVQQARPLSPKEAQRLAIRCMRKGGYGRRGIPREIVRTMHMDYLRLGSLSRVGRLYGRTRQAMYDIFRTARLPLNSRNFHGRILFDGRHWTPGKDGYYRPTTGDRTQRLHYEIWKKATGQSIPPGHQVTFLDGDNTNLTRGNLRCLSIKEVTLHHYARRFPDRAGLTAQEQIERRRAHGRDYMRERAKRWIALGLRSDGKRRKKIQSVPSQR